MFKSFLVKHGLKLSPSYNYKLLIDLNGLRIKSRRKLQNILNLNPLKKPVFQFSMTIFQFLKPGLVKHV